MVFNGIKKGKINFYLLNLFRKPHPGGMLTVNRNTSKKKQENRPPASPLLQKVNVLGTEMKIIGANETVKEVLI
jgi:hypothetical protein